MLLNLDSSHLEDRLQRKFELWRSFVGRCRCHGNAAVCGRHGGAARFSAAAAAAAAAATMEPRSHQTDEKFNEMKT